jgi:hypothetical protein
LGFTILKDSQLKRTLTAKLIGVVDKVRDLHTKFGLRNYRVRIVRVRWTGGERGLGNPTEVSSTDILPTPCVRDLKTLRDVLEPIGRVEEGALQVSEISGRFTEDHLRGRSSEGYESPSDEDCWWEVEWLRLDGQPGERRKFRLSGVPEYLPGSLQWQVTLERAQDSRGRDGQFKAGW